MSNDPQSIAPRPWHGADNPYEALYQHFTAALADLEARLTSGAVPAARPRTPNKGTEPEPTDRI